MAQAPVNIHAIQTNLPNSAYLGKSLTTEGIVIAVLSDGFYIENSPWEPTCPGPSPLDCWDDDNSTSEGIFIFTGTAPDPAYASIGNLVSVVGVVQESNSSADHQAQGTEIKISATPVRVDSVNYTVPPPVAADVLQAATTEKFGQWLPFEGMRVNIPVFLTTSPTGGTVDAKTQAVASNGQFWGVLAGTGATAMRQFRGPGISLLEPVPASAPSTVQRWNGNPSLLLMDSSLRAGSAPLPPLNVSANSTIQNLTGVVDYHISPLGYTAVLLDNFPPYYYGWDPMLVTPGPGAAGTPVGVAAPTQVTIATQQLDAFYDSASSSEAIFTARVSKMSKAIVDMEKSPDVIAVQEVQSMDVLNSLAGAVWAHGGPKYSPCWFSGNDSAGLANGFLINTAKVHLVSCDQVDANKTYATNGGSSATLFERPPLVLTIGVPRGGPQDYAITIVNSELADRAGIYDANDGAGVRAKRAAQAEELSAILQSHQSAGEHVVALGGFDSFEYSDGFVDTVGAIAGTPVDASLVTLATPTQSSPAFVDLTTQSANPPNERYSIVENGSSEQTDHVLVSSDMGSFSSVSYARFGADYPAVDQLDGTTALRASSHDGVVAFLAVPYDTNLTLSSSLNPSLYGQAVSFTAKATGTNGIPSGTVTFYDGSTVLCNAQAMSSGVATCTSGALTVGKHAMKAVYSGDSVYGTATASLTQTVNPIPTTLLLTSAPNPSYFGQTATFAVAIKGSNTAPTGTVTFLDLSTGTTLGTVAVTSSEASLRVVTLTVGAHTIQASYSGDDINASSTSNHVVQVVLTYVAGATLTCSPNPASYGTNVTCVDRLAAFGGTPQGTVTFLDGTVPLGTVTLTGGTAMFTTNKLSVGTHILSANFPGSPQSTGAVSNIVNEVILPVFSLSISPRSQSVYTGEAASYTVTVNVPAGEDFTLKVNLSCSEMIAAATCFFKPAEIAGATSGKLIVQTSAPVNTGASRAAHSSRAALTLLGGVFLLTLPKRIRRRSGRWGLLLLATALTALGVNACGGSGTLTGGTAPGAYAIDVSGSAVNSPVPVVETATANLNVKSLF